MNESDTPYFGIGDALFSDDGLFPDEEGMKSVVKQLVAKPEYRVEDYYKQEGLAQAVARHEVFQSLALLAIAANTIWIGFDIDYNHAVILCEAPALFQIVNNIFCSVFMFEITVRFFAFEHKCNALQDSWFLFDASLVALVVWETWIEVILYKFFRGLTFVDIGSESEHRVYFLRAFRVFRITRAVRMTRLLKALPQLMILVRGMAMAVKSVSATLGLLLFIVYMFAIMGTVLLRNSQEGQGCFDNVPEAMNCLLLFGVFPEQTTLLLDCWRAKNWTYYIGLLLYLLIASLTVMNMLIGVLCEAISVVAATEKEEGKMKELKYKLRDTLDHFDIDGTHVVSKQKFIQLLQNEEAACSLDDVGVDVVELVDCAELIFHQHDELSLDHFVDIVLQLRGTNVATLKDLIDLRKAFTHDIVKLSESVQLAESKTQAARRKALAALVATEIQAPPSEPSSPDPTPAPARATSGLRREEFFM